MGLIGIPKEYINENCLLGLTSINATKASSVLYDKPTSMLSLKLAIKLISACNLEPALYLNNKEVGLISKKIIPAIYKKNLNYLKSN